MSPDLVLVTGGSGFVGAHTILQLLEQGYRVRTTVRSLGREPAVRAMLAAGGADPAGELQFFAADLTADAGWAEAVAGVDLVLHVASPFPAVQPENEDDLIVPARDGALRVLRAAKAAGVKRVVLTSSFAAVGYGDRPKGHVFTEKDWTDPATPGITAYVKSKTVAERAAWDFVAAEGGLELAVINPTGIFGPVLSQDLASSVAIVRGLLAGALPGMPKVSFGVVDVRDVAAAHLLAMTTPAAAGERFLLAAGEPMSLPEVGAALRERLGADAARVPTRVLPDWLVRIAARFSETPRQAVPMLGVVRRVSNAKAKRVLGWQPRTNEDAVAATGESMIRLGLVPKG